MRENETPDKNVLILGQQEEIGEMSSTSLLLPL